MLHALGRDSDELSIVLVDDATIAELNATYRGKNGPTDVLSFAMNEGQWGDVNPSVLGDIVISIPTALRQAIAANHSLLEEVVMLLAHGLLHLLGYDHQTDAEDHEMTKQTKQLVRAALDPTPLRG